jgi:N-acetylglucosamine kinase-like BadF-type ATPase
MKRPLDPSRIEVVDEAVAQILRTKTITERIAMVFAANRTMRLVIEGGVRTQHPEWNNEQVQCEVVRRMSLGTT